MTVKPLLRHMPVTDSGLLPSQALLQLWQSLVDGIGTGGGVFGSGTFDFDDGTAAAGAVFVFDDGVA